MSSPTAEARTLGITTAPGVVLAVDVWEGSGPGMLLVHGLASNARLWDGVAEWLVTRGHAVAALDQRGHGRSSKPEDGYELDSVCADLAAVVRHLGIAVDPSAWSRPVLVGQSWGGNVVLELGYLRPDLTRGLVGVDGGTIELASRFSTWGECASALAPPIFDGITASQLESMFRQMHPDWPEAGIRGSLANFEARPDGTLAPRLRRDHHMEILAALWDHRPSTRYPHLEVPLLLAPADTGDQGWTDAKRAEVAAAASSAPRVRVRWFSPSDHDIHAQHPAELAQAVHEATVDGFFPDERA